ncbi:MAG: hypothetical protein KC464_11625, partial [Myxococcales bacterium]|nr:hypothetical protein [Myxococcales bacterium]
MISATSRSAQQRLDAVRSLAHLDAFDDAAYVAALRDEVTADAKDIAATDGAWAGVEAWDDRLRAALAAIDGYAARSMRIRLDHALADDTTVEPPFRTVLATTVLRYAGDLETLRERVVSVTARVDPAGAAATAAIVVACATTVHAARAALWDGVLGLARDLAAARVDHAR